METLNQDPKNLSLKQPIEDIYSYLGRLSILIIQLEAQLESVLRERESVIQKILKEEGNESLDYNRRLG
jgi:hypothetical protein